MKREELPQIPKNKVNEFIEFMKSKGEVYTAESISPKKLRPVQSEVNKDKVKNMVKNFDTMFKDGWPSLIVSQDYVILDGHHRWLAHYIAHPSENVGIIRFSCPIDRLIELGHEFDGSFVKTVRETTTYRQLAMSMI